MPPFSVKHISASILLKTHLTPSSRSSLQMYVLRFHSLLPHSITTIIFFFIIITSSPLLNGQDLDQFSTCINSLYSCDEEIKDIGYPFWGGDRPKECGHPLFELTCDDNTNYTTMILNSQSFRVIHIDNPTKYLMNIVCSDFLDDVCPNRSITETRLIDGLFVYLDVENVTLHFDCSTSNLPQNYSRFEFKCNEGGVEKLGFLPDDIIPSSLKDPYEKSCESKIEVPISEIGLKELRKNLSTEFLELLNQGIYVAYNGSFEYCFACEKSDGICWSGTSLEEPTCLCRDGIYPYICGYEPNKGNKRVGLKIGIAIGGVAFGAIAIGLCFFVYNKRYKKPSVSSSYLMSRSAPSYPSSSTNTDLEKSAHYHGVPLFDYNELEEATDNFDSKNELGDGGFGTVYKGKLRDGRVVAVKRLYENNYKRVEQFMNEIEILAQKRHKNLVTLYGCTSRHSRELLLIYEYISNGTIADHLHGGHARPGSLTWTTRLSIAIETASALAYLHASDVIHRDVKTNNILLDDNFCVKVADFGLSRLFPIHATHVSTAPQGTPGYVDPEYHECYQLTSKSDVYSFGVVLIELISSLPAVDITRHRHEINLSNMAINKIQCNALHELVDKNLGFESDAKVGEMITAVAELAFQCLQSGKDLRPTMQQVLESLVEIQNMDSSTGKRDSKGSPTDSSLLLKNNEPTLSPNSVINAQWPSRSTTNSSSSY